jgi:hypothetical protein
VIYGWRDPSGRNFNGAGQMVIPWHPMQVGHRFSRMVDQDDNHGGNSPGFRAPAGPQLQERAIRLFKFLAAIQQLKAKAPRQQPEISREDGQALQPCSAGNMSAISPAHRSQPGDSAMWQPPIGASRNPGRPDLRLAGKVDLSTRHD